MTKKITALLLVLVLLFSLAACGGTKSSEEPAKESETAGKETPTTESKDAAEGDAKSPDNDLVIANNTDVQALDPHLASDGLSFSRVSPTMHEGLIVLDKEGKITPLLAESYELLEDGVTYRFTLRQGVTFHDGEPFNAAAVIANIDRNIQDDSLRQHRRVIRFAAYEAVEEFVVDITQDTPESSFLNHLAGFRFASPKAIEELGKEGLAKTPVGTGPYKFDERVDGDYVRVVPYENYWREGPSVNSLTFKAVPEDGARIAMLQTGEADFIFPMPAIQVPQVENDPNITVKVQDSNTIRYVTLNMNLPELSDVRVRQAMNLAIDKDAYIQVVFQGYGSNINSPYSGAVPYHAPQTPYTFDLEKAKGLMADAGYADGFKLTLWGDNMTSDQTGMQFVAQQLAQIGIEVEVLPMEPSTQADMRNVPEAEATINMWYVNWSASSNDADGSLRNILYGAMIPPEGYNSAYFKNAEFDTLLDEARAASDLAELTEKYGKAQAIVWEQAPWLFLASDQHVWAQRTYVTGLEVPKAGPHDYRLASLNVE